LDITKGYKIRGKRGPFVVLLHSSMSSKDQWVDLTSKLSSQFRLIAIDLAGYGDNELPSNPDTFSTNNEISLVKNIIEKEIKESEQFHLIGHSYGGAISLKLAVEIPNRIQTLTFFEPVAFHLLPPLETAYNEVMEIVEKLSLALKENNKTLAAQLFIDYWSGKGTFKRLAVKNQEMFINYIDKVSLDFKALFNETLNLCDYSKIDIPICMIKGEKSPISSLSIFEILEQNLSIFSVHSVPGGHMSPITHFKHVNKIIEDFLILQAFQ
jgi:pimeloyl-ACP methyl ester carboxylesterase